MAATSTAPTPLSPPSPPGSTDSDALPPIRLAIPTRFLLLPTAALATGLAVGFVRGSRAASLRFLAENAHRPPRTVQGWYFYQKTKNYRVIFGGLKGGGSHALRLALTSLVWLGLEEGLDRVGEPWREARQVGAGLGTSVAFAVAYQLPMARTAALGVLVGGTLRALEWSRDLLKQEATNQLEAQQGDSVSTNTDS